MPALFGLLGVGVVLGESSGVCRVGSGGVVEVAAGWRSLWSLEFDEVCVVFMCG